MLNFLLLGLWDRLDWNKSTGQKLKYYLWQILVLFLLAIIMAK